MDRDWRRALEPPRRVARAESCDGRLPLLRRRRDARVREQGVDVGRRILIGVRRLEVGALDEREHVCVLVVVQLLLPVALSDDDAVGYRARLRHEVLAAHGHGLAGQVAEGRLVYKVDEVARVLELNGEEERARSIDALDLDATGVRAALV